MVLRVCGNVGTKNHFAFIGMKMSSFLIKNLNNSCAFVEKRTDEIFIVIGRTLILKRKWSAFLVLVMLMTSIGSFAGVASAADPVLTKLVLSTNEVTLQTGDTASLTATAVYDTGKTTNVTVDTDWSTESSAVATVYNGTITAKAEGTSVISASYQGLHQTVAVNVTKKVKGLTKDVQKLELRSGQTANIALTATYTDNSTAEVANKADWTTDNDGVATVLNGKVTAVGAGTATIKAVYGKQTVTVPVSVDVVKRLDVDQSQLSLLLKDKESVTVKATFPDGTEKDVTAEAEWSSSNPTVADVLKGEITAYSAGQATITAKYGTMSATVAVDVDTTSKLKASESDVFMYLDATKAIEITAVYPDGSTAVVTNDSTWTSSNASVASVNKGNIMANAAGTAVISAKYGDKTVNIQVDVETARYLDLSEEKVSLQAKESKQLTLKATYIDGKTEDITDKATWTSSNSDTVFVSKGEVTGYKSGEATVTASYGGKNATVKVAVDVPSDVTLSTKTLTIDVNETHQAKLTADYGDGRTEDVSADAEWSTSSATVASVTSAGLIKGESSGKAVITATYNSKKYTMNVEVGLVDKLETETQLIIMGAQETKQLKVFGIKGTERVDVTADADWKTGNIKVAEVSKGLVNANGRGKTNITASYGNQKITFTVEVDIATSVEASEVALSLKSGDKKTVTLTMKSSDGSTKDVTSQAQWKTSNYKVATVKDGQITAVAYGKTNITGNYGGKTYTVRVDVDTLKYLQTDEVLLTLTAGQTAQLTATATFMDGTDKDVTKPALWTSSKITVATVKDGKIKAQSKGRATITIKYAGKTTRVNVTVQ